MLTIIVRNFFEEDGKFYPQVYLDECMNYKNGNKHKTLKIKIVQITYLMAIWLIILNILTLAY